MKQRVVLQVLVGITLAVATAAAQGVGQPAVDPSGAITISGPVLSFVAVAGTGHPAMTVNDASRGSTSFVLGPFRYLESVSFSAATGDQVEAVLYPCPLCTSGWVAARVDNLSNGSSAVLRGADGMPLWNAGGMGQGGGRGAARRANGRTGPAGMSSAGVARLGTRARACGGNGLDMSAVATASGTVAAFSGGPGQGTPTLTLHTADGDLDLMVSPYRTLAAADLSLDNGRALKVAYAPVAGTDGEVLAALSVTDSATGVSVQLRDSTTGMPLAGGFGRRGGR